MLKNGHSLKSEKLKKCRLLYAKVNNMAVDLDMKSRTHAIVIMLL